LIAGKRMIGSNVVSLRDDIEIRQGGFDEDDVGAFFGITTLEEGEMLRKKESQAHVRWLCARGPLRWEGIDSICDHQRRGRFRRLLYGSDLDRDLGD
jgi:hypothetical protein